MHPVPRRSRRAPGVRTTSPPRRPERRAARIVREDTRRGVRAYVRASRSTGRSGSTPEGRPGLRAPAANRRRTRSALTVWWSRVRQFDPASVEYLDLMVVDAGRKAACAASGSLASSSRCAWWARLPTPLGRGVATRPPWARTRRLVPADPLHGLPGALRSPDTRPHRPSDPRRHPGAHRRGESDAEIRQGTWTLRRHRAAEAGNDGSARWSGAYRLPRSCSRRWPRARVAATGRQLRPGRVRRGRNGRRAGARPLMNDSSTRYAWSEAARVPRRSLDDLETERPRQHRRPNLPTAARRLHRSRGDHGPAMRDNTEPDAARPSALRSPGVIGCSSWADHRVPSSSRPRRWPSRSVRASPGDTITGNSQARSEVSTEERQRSAGSRGRREPRGSAGPARVGPVPARAA